jgi:hypothetical protein
MRMSVIEWLLDSDPSIRWQVMRDVIAESDATVASERSRVTAEGWGARLLDLQGSDGHWGGAAFVPHAWISTMDTLQLLRDLGVDPTSDRARTAIGRVRERCTWGEEFGHSPFFEGEVEPCINGRVLASGAYFGEASDPLVDRLLQERLSDGGWNCDAPRSLRSSFHTTICVLEGLLEYERAKGPVPDVTGARVRGQEYLLARRLFRSRFLQLAHPRRMTWLRLGRAPDGEEFTQAQAYHSVGRRSCPRVEDLGGLGCRPRLHSSSCLETSRRMDCSGSVRQTLRSLPAVSFNVR